MGLTKDESRESRPAARVRPLDKGDGRALDCDLFGIDDLAYYLSNPEDSFPYAVVEVVDDESSAEDGDFRRLIALCCDADAAVALASALSRRVPRQRPRCKAIVVRFGGTDADVLF